MKDEPRPTNGCKRISGILGCAHRLAWLVTCAVEMQSARNEKADPRLNMRAEMYFVTMLSHQNMTLNFHVETMFQFNCEEVLNPGDRCLQPVKMKLSLRKETSFPNLFYALSR